MRKPGARKAQGHQEPSRWLQRSIRWIWRAVAGTLLGVLLLFLLIKVGLSLGILRHWFEQTASDIAKFPIRVQGSTLAMWGPSLLEGIDVFESSGNTHQPWLKIHSLEADISLENLAWGKVLPSRVVAINPVVSLEFDDNNDLLTNLPKPEDYPPGRKMPRLILKDGEFQIRQGKKRLLKIRNIQGEAWRDENNILIFESSSQDAKWGEWTLKARIEPGDGNSLLVLSSSRVEVTQDLLESLPFVPAKVWENVRLNGLTNVDLELFFDGKKSGCQYKVQLSPRQTRVRVEAIKLEAENAHGNICIQDGLVQLRDIQGDSANGTIELAKGDLDFRDKCFLMDYDLKVKGLQIHDLPHEWGLRDKKGNSLIQGILDGWAKLQLREDPLLGVFASGTGKGIIEGAKLLGFPTKPIPLELKPDGSKFRLRPAVGLPGLLPTSSRKKTVPLPQNQQTFLETQIAMEVDEPGDLAKRLGLALPAKLNGKLLLELGFQVPLKSVADPLQYQGQIQARMTEGVFGTVSIPEWKGTATLEQGEVLIPDLMMRIKESDRNSRDPGGEIHAGVKLDLANNMELHLRAQASSIPSGIITPWLLGPLQWMHGKVSFGLEALGDLDASRFHSWRGNALFRWDQWHWGELSLPEVHGKLQLQKGRLDLEDLRGDGDWGKLTGLAFIQLEKSFPFELTIQGVKVDMGRLGREFKTLVGDLGVRAEAAGKLIVSGEGNGGNLLAKADITIPSGAIARVSVENLSAQIKVDGRGVEVTEARGKAFGAPFAFAGNMPFSRDLTGNGKLKFNDLDIANAFRALMDRDSIIRGKLSAILDFRLSPGNTLAEREVDARLETTSCSLDVAGVPCTKILATTRWGKSGFGAEMETVIAEGQGKLEIRHEYKGRQVVRGNLHLENARLKTLLPAMEVHDNLRALDGIWTLNIPLELDLDTLLPSGKGTLDLHQLKHGIIPLSELLQCDVEIANNEIHFKDIHGTVAEGQLRGIALVDLNNMDRSNFKGTIIKAEMSKLFAPWMSFLRPAGKMDIRVQGKLGREISANGEGLAGAAKIMGMEVGDWRVPFDMQFAPARGAGSLVLRDVSGNFAQGKITGSTEYRWGVGTQLQGAYRFQSLDLRSAQAQLGDSPSQSAGTLQGKIQFSGRDVKSLEQITANLEGNLVHSRAQGVPIVRDLVPFLPVAATGAFFDRGELKARLDRGVIHVNRLSMSNALMMVLIEGNITLQGKLDMEATARTGNISALPDSMRNMGLRMPALGAVPLELISQATNTLAAGLLRFKIQGTYKNPVVRSVPLTLLTEEAIRFFLGR